jgi:YebC/PmpR family DNA-binding regulatory protein
MPKDNIERSIKRGTGEDKEGAAFVQAMYEGYASHGVGLIIEVITDNRNRTVADLRHILDKMGGNLAEAGAVSWQFKRAAYFAVELEGLDQEKIFECAVEAGADDVLIEEDVEIIGPVDAYKRISDCLQEAGYEPIESGIRMLPNATIELQVDQTLQVMRVIEAVEDLEDVKQVFSNLHVSDEAVMQLAAA